MPFRKILLTAVYAGSILSLAQPAHAEWLEAKSTHFTITGDVDEALLKRRIERLERFDAMLRQIIVAPTQTNLPIMMVDSPETVKRLQGNPNGGTLAFFVPSPFGVFAVAPAKISSDYGLNAETVVFHEYVHHMMMGSYDDPIPRWMNEGMAELFMNSRLESDGGVTIGLGNEARGYSLNRISRWSVDRLFDSDVRQPRADEVDQIYAKGWLVLHYLFFSGKRPGQFGKFLGELKRGVPQRDAARNVFGDLGKFEEELEFYRQRRFLPAVRISADQLKAATGATVRKLGPDFAAIMPLRLQSMVGVNDKTGPVVLTKGRPIGAQYPSSAFVQRALAEMAFDAKQYDEADAAIDRSLAAEPDNVSALSYKGFLLGNRAHREGKNELWRQARTLILKANRLAPNDPLPFILYFDSFIASGVKPNQGAIDGLMRAIVLQPSYLDLRVRAGLQFLAAGDSEKARALIAPVAFAPHAKPDRPIVKLLGEMDKKLAPDALRAKVIELKVSTGNLFIVSPPEDTAK